MARMRLHEVAPEIQEKNKKFCADAYEEYSRDDEIHGSFYCPQCEKKNWLYFGRKEDFTAPDRHNCECWSCKKSFWVVNTEFVRDFYIDEFEKAKGDFEVMLQECGGGWTGKQESPVSKD